MADDEDYDPNAGVAPWINIVIPIISMVIFIVAMVAVYFMPYEIAVERLDLWAEKIPCRKKKPAPENKKYHEKNVYNIRGQPQPNKAYLHDTGSHVISENTSMCNSEHYYYGSTATMISFESSV